MNNFELIDDYLANRLKGGEKEAFEKQLENDPSLKSELDFQKQVVEGIRSARALELKGMLNKVPVGGAGTTIEFSVMKMAAGLITAAMIGGAIYYYASSHEMPPFDKAATDIGGETKTKQEITPEQKTPEVTPTPEVKEEPKKGAVGTKEEVKPVEKPAIDVADPTEEMNGSDNLKKNEPVSNSRADITPSSVVVELDAANKKFDFHYQFVNNKLMLYGPFDKSLYEILEVNGENHAVFLYYKETYYMLNEKQSKVARLEPITNTALINSLREYRKK